LVGAIPLHSLGKPWKTPCSPVGPPQMLCHCRHPSERSEIIENFLRRRMVLLQDLMHHKITGPWSSAKGSIRSCREPPNSIADPAQDHEGPRAARRALSPFRKHPDG
jgi:hypothetical protein